MKKEIFVVGHKNPDTDSICSALSYAYLKNQISDEEYIAMRAGDINPETAFVLDYFNIDAPSYIEDVRAQVKDADYNEGETVDGLMSMKEAWSLLHEKKAATLGIVDESNIIQGIVSVGDIAKFFMETNDERILAEAETPYENIIETVEGTVVAGSVAGKVATGKVFVATAGVEKLADMVEEGDTVILADKTQAQKCVIENGAGCVIVCLGAEIDEEVIKLAEENDCLLISSNNDSYVNARMLTQSIPVEYIMIKDKLMVFQEEEFIDDVKDAVATTRHREFPVVDEQRQFKGVLTRSNLIDVNKKQVIMVDHNEKNQAVSGIGDAEIIEIVDHHKVGHIKTLGPVFYRNMPVGCTATIIYTMFKENQVEIPKDIAGLMCSAILSDTLLFRSPTCTPLDKKAGEELAEIAGINAEEYALDMFAAGSDFGSKSEKEIFNLDYKKFTAGDVSYGVGQVSSVSKKELDNMKEKMLLYMEDFVEDSDVDMVFLMLTDILAESSELLCAGDRALEIAEKAFGVKKGDRSVYLEGAVSRKKQIIPQITGVLQ